MCAPVLTGYAATGEQDTPKQEFRATWVASLGIDWPVSSGAKGTTDEAAALARAEACGYLDIMKASGLNAVFVHVRPMGDRLFLKTEYDGSKVYESFSHYASGTRGVETCYDPLEMWIEEAHKRGMELHAWINPYRIATVSGQTTSLPSNYTAYDRTCLENGHLLSYYNSSDKKTYFVFNPALAATKARIANVCRVLCGNYDIDGIVFDDYFYPSKMGSDTSESCGDYSDYLDYLDNGGGMSIAEWRRENVNSMIAKVYKAIKDVKPWVRFGVSPAGVATKGVVASDGIPALSNYCSASDWQYADIASDPMAWMREKSLDYISPQLYWKNGHSTNSFAKLVEWWSIVADKMGRPCFPSHSISFINSESANNTTGWDEVNEQILNTRRYNLDGQKASVIYSACNFDGAKNKGLGEYLRQHAFSALSAVPPMKWEDATDPGTVSDITFADGTLSWTGVNASTMRYLVYAVPENVTLDDAKSVDGGLRAEYLVDATYTTSLAIDGKDSGYWFAVAPYDRFGNEWTLTTGASSGVEDLVAAHAIRITCDGTTIDFGCRADAYAVYDLTGRCLAQGSSATGVSATAMSGTIIVRVSSGANTATAKLHLN